MESNDRYQYQGRLTWHCSRFTDHENTKERSDHQCFFRSRTRLGAIIAVYSATKTAVRAISESLRKEVKPYNLRTTILCPGAVESELKHGSSSEMASGAMENFYAHNEIPASSFASTVLFAISQPEEVDINEIIFRPTRQEV